MDVHHNGLEITSRPPIVDGELRTFFEYWLDLGRASGGLPSAQAFDPLRVTRLLPYLWLIEVDPESRRLRTRLAGENVNAVYHRNIGGKFFAEVYADEDLRRITERVCRCLTDPAILYSHGYVYEAVGGYCLGERLGLPMLGRDGGTSVLLGATIYGGHTESSEGLSVTGAKPQFIGIRAANHTPVEIAGS